MGISVKAKYDGDFEGYRTQEQRDLAMISAALNKDPTFFRDGDMTPEQKQEYEKMVKEFESIPSNVSVDVGYNMD